MWLGCRCLSMRFSEKSGLAAMWKRAASIEGRLSTKRRIHNLACNLGVRMGFGLRSWL
jgi:hypothetical protein